jgi:hypothetical protein
MKTVKVTESVTNLSEVLDLASEENVILETVDGREFIVAELDDFEGEIKLIRQNKELMKFLEERSKETKTFTLDQVKEQLNLL